MNGTIIFEQGDIDALEQELRDTTGLPWKFQYAHAGNAGILKFRLDLGRETWAEAQSNLEDPERLYGVTLEGYPMYVLHNVAEYMLTKEGEYPWENKEEEENV